ncbi:MAG TPA: hypothetical protein VFE65_23020 [Pseudonocardia sp.]|jgi:hypothetical protein|nr:hypothetical protein [Pseudonocardia sp.]
MSGSASTDHGEPYDSDASSSKDPKTSFPWQLGASVFAWIVLGGLLVASALGGGSSGGSEADQGQVDQIQGSLGQSAAATSPSSGQHPTLYVLLGAVVLLMALLLLIGQSWSQYVLYVLAVVSVILYASGGRWESIAALALFVVGAVLLLNRPVQRYFNAKN